MAEGDLSRHDVYDRHRAATACAITDAADDVGLGDDTGHLSAIVADHDKIPSRIIQQFRSIDQEGVGFDRSQLFLNRWQDLLHRKHVMSLLCVCLVGVASLRFCAQAGPHTDGDPRRCQDVICRQHEADEARLPAARREGDRACSIETIIP
jgi:hypothetical protein